MEFYTVGQLEAIKLTGRTRVRSNWLGKLILQVEMLHPKSDGMQAPRPGPYDPWVNGSFTFWRDARLSDMSAICPPEVRADSTTKSA